MTEHQRLGNRVAREAVGAVGAAHGLAGGEEPRHTCREPGVHLDAAHVIVGDWRDLDRRPRQVDVVRVQPIDHRPEGIAQRGLADMGER